VFVPAPGALRGLGADTTDNRRASAMQTREDFEEAGIAWYELEIMRTGSENGWATFAYTGRHRYAFLDGSMTDWISPEGNDQ
jgi:hypothetical protein